MKRKLQLALLAGMTLSSGWAFAQNVTLQPTFGAGELGATEHGRSIYTVQLVAGGRLDAAESVGIDFRGNDCKGLVADAPDYRVQYTAGTVPLLILVRSREDTTLVVNAPDGRWYCDDTTGGWPDPLIEFDDAQSGQYDIWVGAFEGYPEAVLILSESRALLP